MTEINVVSLKEACKQMEREEKEVRKLIRRYPALAPQKILGRMACTPEWIAKFQVAANDISRGLCLHCGKPWDGEPPQHEESGEPPAAE